MCMYSEKVADFCVLTFCLFSPPPSLFPLILVLFPFPFSLSSSLTSFFTTSIHHFSPHFHSLPSPFLLHFILFPGLQISGDQWWKHSPLNTHKAWQWSTSRPWWTHCTQRHPSPRVRWQLLLTACRRQTRSWCPRTWCSSFRTAALSVISRILTILSNIQLL